MKPKAEDEHDSGLLEYLEDIIGTRHYVEYISKAAGQLEETSEERRKHLQLVKVARTHGLSQSCCTCTVFTCVWQHSTAINVFPSAPAHLFVWGQCHPGGNFPTLGVIVTEHQIGEQQVSQ